MRQQLPLPLPSAGTTSPWFTGRVPRSQWAKMRGPLGDMPGAPFIYWYRESVNPFPKRQKGRGRGSAWRQLTKDPGFWVMLRFIDNADEDVSRIEFAPWLAGDARVSLLAEACSTDASVAAFARRFPSFHSRSTA